MERQSDLVCCEKPDYISFDAIHDLLWKANDRNRKDGFLLSTSEMTGRKLQERIGSDGHCFVAFFKEQLVGTLSLRYLNRDNWFAKGKVADFMLAGVLPEFQGQHISTALFELAFKKAKEEGCSVVELDTAETNTHAIGIYKHLGFRLVGYKANPGGDHYSVIMVKWLDGCPFSERYCSLRYMLKRLFIRIRYKENKKKRFGI